MRRNISRRKLNTIFLFVIAGLYSFISIGYSALSQNLMVSGDVSYLYHSRRLYDVLKRAAEDGTYAREYTGEHQDSMAGVGSKKIYHWYGSSNANGTAILDKNNVIFAGHCWQMIRTTDTGGVKMIYNGEAENNQCLSTRGTHVGYAARTTQTLNTTYYYGTSYTYDKTNNVFSLDGTITTGSINQGEYTCKQTTSSGTCATLYLVDTLWTGSSYYVIPVKGNSNYSQFGTVQLNQKDSSLAYAGYMYNAVYAENNKGPTSVTVLPRVSMTSSTNYYYGTGITYDSSTNKYTLTGVTQNTWANTYANANGIYTCNSTTQTSCEKVYYVVGGASSFLYGFEMTDGNLVDYYNTNIKLGTSYTESGGLFTITNLITVSKIDWFSNYENYKNYYTCGDSSTACTNMHLIVSTNSSGYYTIFSENNYVYGNSFTYNSSTNTYTLNNTVQFWDMSSSNNISSLRTHHYTCFNTTGECETLGYIYSADEASSAAHNICYTELTDGKSVENIISEMLDSDYTNTADSVMKKALDAWYKKYLLIYGGQIEDTIFCNDRTIIDLAGWDPNGGPFGGSHSVYDEYLKFNNYNIFNNSNNVDLSCADVVDRFSLSNSKARLLYPVGLITGPETNNLGSSVIKKTGQKYWLLSPNSYYNLSAYASYVAENGSLGRYNVNSSYGVRPVISLIPGIKYSSGTGSMADPYIISDYISNTNFNDGAISGGTRNVTITFPSGCGSSLTCSYKKDNGSSVNVTSSSVVVNFTNAGTLNTVVSDDVTTLNNSHLVRFDKIYVSSSGNDTSGNGSIASPYKTLTKAYDMTDDTATIYVMNNLTATATTTFDRNKNITITSCTKSGSTCPTSNANSINRGSSFTDSLLDNKRGTLNLTIIAFDGNDISANDSLVVNRDALNLNLSSYLKRNNNSGNGGGVYNYGTLTLNDTNILENRANSGAGIYNNGGEVTINSGNIESNGAGVSGGALWSNSKVTINGGAIEYNSARMGAGVQCTYSDSSKVCNLTMTGGGILYNYASSSTQPANGGGIYINSDYTSIPTVNISGGEISNNETSTSSSDTAGGAGIMNKGDLTLGAVNISNNTAQTGGGGIQNAGTLTINGATITNNTAAYGGGINNTVWYSPDDRTIGTLTFNSGTISTNNSTQSCGAIRVYSSIANIKGGTIDGNTATTFGGGICLIYNANSPSYNSSNTIKGKLNISGGTISNNTAGTNGGGVYVNYDNDHQNVLTISNVAKINSNKATDGSGGGIYNLGITNITGGTIASNTAKVRGGGIYSTKTLTMSSGTIGGTNSSLGNKTTTGAGGGIFIYSGTGNFTGGTIRYNTGYSYGGGIYLENGVTATMSSTTVQNNIASTQSGGGIHVAGTFTLNSAAVIASNTASNGKGGGVNVTSTGTFTQNGSTIKKNTAKSDGGISVTSGGSYSRPNGNGYICKNNSPTNSYDTTATSNTNCS